MPSAKIYIAYAAAGISTITGGAIGGGIPEITHNLTLDHTSIRSPLQPYLLKNSGTTIPIQRAESTQSTTYLARGKTIAINTKIKLNKTRPLLEKEKYNFLTYED